MVRLAAPSVPASSFVTPTGTRPVPAGASAASPSTSPVIRSGRVRATASAPQAAVAVARVPEKRHERRLIEQRWKPDQQQPACEARSPREEPAVAPRPRPRREEAAADPRLRPPRVATAPVPEPRPLREDAVVAPTARPLRRGVRLPRPHRAVIVVSAIVLAVGMSVAVSNASRWGRTAQSFVLDQIEVRGNRVLTEHEVTALSGLELGTNLLTVRIGDVEAAVSRSPRVQRVRASRALPGRMVVTLEEKVPIALVARGRGEALEVAEDGTVLPAAERSGYVDLPLVTGVEAADTAPPPEELRTALSLIVLAKEAAPAFAAEISEVRIAPGSGLVIYTVADGAEIRVGTGALDSRGMQRLSMVLSDLQSRGVKAESIDVRFRDQIVVRPCREAAAGRA